MTLGLMIIDQYWWLMIPGIVLGLYAQLKLKAAYARYSRVPSERGLTGAETARIILDHAGLSQVAVAEVGGHLTDHYDPTRKALFLSSANFQSTSLAALGVAAHEAGHALQHQAAYAPLKFRMMLVPVTQFASSAVYGIILLSFFMGLAKLAGIAVGIFAIITLFQMVTLPVEFNASRRAKEKLLSLGLITARESAGVSRVLSGAAMTYVAAMVASLMELLHWALILRGDRD
ncbi:MAG TPA: zinc metallopeptidase [Candidatus Paceibacterota bacterium]|nr:zinc metallopeptidase [Verrucomicrobiota bacterium]HRZ47680.1 zinc metallopeptidase [Candidatus Paceibacterota bacterium]